MNWKLIARITGVSLLVEAGALLLPLFTCLYYGEDPVPFLLTICLLLAAGLGPALLLRPQRQFFTRDGFFTVGLIWVLMSAFGALPFYFCGQFGSYVDCLFECVSGFTTTGSSILPAVEDLPYGQLFWRSFTHWLGGMGVLVFTTAILSSLGISSNFLIRAESPGPVKSKLVPRASQSSKILYAIYLALTLIQVGLLRLTGMPWFDSLVNTFGTAGTGGFSVRNTSIGAYGNPAAEIIMTVFMLLFSVNFAMYFLLLCGKLRQVLRSDELRFFLGVVAFSIAAITVNIAPSFDRLGDAVRAAAFQVASIISTSGFSSVDFDLWPEFSRMLLVVLMFIGACAGSTGGGIKCSRVLLLLRSARREVGAVIHPRAVSVVHLDGEPVSERVLHTTHCYFVIYLFTVFTACLVVGLDDFSFGTTFTAVVTCISNVGPGLEAVGPMGNFSAFSDLSKLTLSFCMIAGRLEMFPIFALLSKKVWKRS